jgi:hypothetical protein
MAQLGDGDNRIDMRTVHGRAMWGGCAAGGSSNTAPPQINAGSGDLSTTLACGMWRMRWLDRCQRSTADRSAARGWERQGGARSPRWA